MTAGNDSAHGGVIRFPTSAFDSHQPLDTGHVRDGLVNNLEALYNGAAQIRVNTTFPARQWGSENNPLPKGHGNETYFKIRTFEFPLTLLKDGSPAPLYIEIAGAGVGAVGSDDVQFAVQLRYKSIRTFDNSNTNHWFGFCYVTDTSLAWYPIRNRVDLKPYVRMPDSIPVIERTYKTRNAPGEDRARQDVTVIDAALDVYIHLPAGSSASGVSWAGILVRESPWNAYDE